MDVWALELTALEGRLSGSGSIEKRGAFGAFGALELLGTAGLCGRWKCLLGERGFSRGQSSRKD